MPSIRSFLITAVLALPAFSAVHAASSDWHRVEGASVRLVTSGVADSDGRLRGALEIRLEPGWKTYWLDPGSSGIPPTLAAMANGQPAAVDIGFPEPRRFDDDYAQWAGYDHTVALALTFNLPAESQPGLDANVFLGVCETICIPVQARLRVAPDLAAHHRQDEMIVQAAFDALPRPAEAQLRARPVELGNKALTVEAVAPEGVDVLDLFVAGTPSMTLGVPVRTDEDGRTRFVIPAHGTASAQERFVYTLVTNAGAVTGTFEMP